MVPNRRQNEEIWSKYVLFYQHITMHLFEGEKKNKKKEEKKTACLEESREGKTVPDFIRKSILLFFGAVGYFIKNPSIASLKRKEK